MRSMYVMGVVVWAMAVSLVGPASIGAEEVSPSLAREMAKMEGPDVDRALAVVTAMQAQGMAEAQAVTLLEMVRRAHEEGTPAHPLLDKAEEGLAKRVRGDQLLSAMERVHQRYRDAGAWSEGMAGDAATHRRMTGAMADALAAGMTHDDMARLRERMMARDGETDGALAEESVLAVREMVRARVGSASATDTVDAALEQGYGAGEMAQLRETFHQKAGQGNGEMLANQYTQAIRGGMSASDLGTHSSRHGAQNGSGASGHGSMGGSGSGSGGNGSSGGGGHGGGGHGGNK